MRRYRRLILKGGVQNTELLATQVTIFASWMIAYVRVLYSNRLSVKLEGPFWQFFIGSINVSKLSILICSKPNIVGIIC